MNIRQRINMWEHYLGKRRVSFTTTNCSSAMINNNKEENKMTKISMDKKYKMRDGQAVRVLCVDGGGRWPVIVLTSDGGIYRMPADGYYLSNKTESLYDLIEIKPTKQITVDVWINVYPRGTSVGHASKELAESMAFADQIDCFNFKRTYEVEVNSDEE